MFRVPELYSDSGSDSATPGSPVASVQSYATAPPPACSPEMADFPMIELAPAPGAPRHVLPSLPEFYGSGIDYPVWRASLRAKIRVDGQRMGGDYGMIATILGALKGNAQRLCSPSIARLLEDDSSVVSHAIAILDRTFDDPQLKQNALKQWSKLSQGTTPFNVFYAEFERLLAEAGGESFDERVKIAQLQESTSNEIVRLGFAADDCQTVEQLAQLYRKISVGLASFKAPRTIYATPYSSSSSAPAQAHYAPMEIDVPGSFSIPASPPRRPRTPPAPTRVNFDGGRGAGLPTDNALRGRVAKWVTPEEIKRRRSAGTCLRCNRRGCRVAICPLAAARRPASPARPARVYMATGAHEVGFDAESVCEPGPCDPGAKARARAVSRRDLAEGLEGWEDAD